MVTELEERGRELSRRYETVMLQTELLGSLPAQIHGMKETLEKMRELHQLSNETRPEDPNLILPLPATQALVEERRAELNEVNKRLRSLQQALPRQSRILEREERELEVLEQERERAVNGAREAVKRKREGGGAGELELRGRWLQGVDTGLRGLLGVEA